MATEDNIVISFSAPYRYFGFETAVKDSIATFIKDYIGIDNGQGAQIEGNCISYIASDFSLRFRCETYSRLSGSIMGHDIPDFYTELYSEIWDVSTVTVTFDTHKLNILSMLLHRYVFETNEEYKKLLEKDREKQAREKALEKAKELNISHADAMRIIIAYKNYIHDNPIESAVGSTNEDQ